MLDLHCHILPAIDDGPGDMDGSLALAEALVTEEVGTVAATPHCRADHPGVVPAELAERCARLNERLRRHEVRLEAVPGGEVDLLWGLEASDEELRLVSYLQLGNTLLLETPYGPLPTAFEELLYQFTLKGYRLLLAHPERNPTLREDHDRLAELVRRGALVQVTASSLTGSPKRSRTSAAAHAFLKRGLAHVIASDAHGVGVSRSSLREGALAAAELVGKPLARWLVRDAPAAIIAGRALPSRPEPQLQRRPLLERLGF